MRRIVLFTALILLTSSLGGVDYKINRFGNGNGLSNSSVTCILQDSLGRMWFGTWDGLNVYDSRDFATFKPSLGDTTSISNNVIRSIVEERSGLLWISTDYGINRLDLAERCFRRYFIGTAERGVFSENSFLIVKNPGDKIAAYVRGQGFFMYDGTDFHHDGNPIGDVQMIALSSDNGIWYLTDEGKLYFHVSGHRDDRVVMEGLRTFFIDPSTDIVYAQKQDASLCFYNPTSGLDFSLPYEIPGRVRDMLFTSEGILVGSDKGLFQIGGTLGSTEVVIDGVPVLSLYKGTQDIIWVGTDMQGVWALHPSKKSFKIFPSNGNTAFENNAVRAFAEDRALRLWVGTKGAGLYVLNPELTEVVSHFTTSSGLVDNSIYALAEGPTEMWIGTDGRGINYYDKRSKRIYSLAFPNDDIVPSSIYSILPDGNQLWVGTSGQGVFKIGINRRETPYKANNVRQYTHIPDSNSLSLNIVYDICRGGDDTLLVATRGSGVDILNTVTDYFTPLVPDTKLEEADVLCICKGSDGDIWLGTSLGLFWIREDGEIVEYTEDNGLPNNTIHGIVEDSRHNIWASSNYGLVRLVPSENGHRIMSYFQEDGLQNNEFSDGAFYRSSRTGDIFFGGISGVNAFNAMDINSASYIPHLLLKGFRIDNKETILSLHEKFRHNKSYLNLGHSVKSFGFTFVPVDYVSGSKCRIRYRLRGWQDNWVGVSAGGEINFSGLRQGRYVLEVNCSNANMEWSDELFTESIRVNPPWSKTIYAYLGYLLLTASLVIFLYHSARSRAQARNRQLREEAEKRRQVELQEAKLSFFTDIAHEFSNTLTLIYGPCEKLLSDPATPQGTKKYLRVISSNSDRMKHLTHQLLDFRKAESGHLALIPAIVDISSIIFAECDNYREILDEREICLQLHVPPSLIWHSDRDSVEKIVFNLMSNAVKYTPHGESIVIEASADEKLLIKITNTGVGIAADQQEVIFNKFEAVRRVEKALIKGGFRSTGLGLALCHRLSELLNGSISVESDGCSYTRFILVLPALEGTVVDSPVQAKDESTMMHGHAIAEIKANMGPPIAEMTDKPLVLVVDDEVGVRSFISDSLRDNYAVVEASDGQEALTYVRKYSPDIVISDLVMPIMGGIELLRALRSDGGTKHIPFIMLSAQTAVKQQIEGLDCGADAYLVKPFDPHHLLALVKGALSREKAIYDYSKSAYAAVRRFEGMLVKKEDRDFVLKITATVLDNMKGSKLSIENLAAKVAMSETQFYRKVKELLGMSPVEYVKTVRLQHAAGLLTTTNMGISEIMYDCGFSGRSWFYREFSKVYGLTPGEYRKSQLSDT